MVTGCVQWYVQSTNLRFIVQGWEKLTDAVIHWLNFHRSGLVFILWGAYAQKKGAFIDQVCRCRTRPLQNVLSFLFKEFTAAAFSLVSLQ